MSFPRFPLKHLVLQGTETKTEKLKDPHIKDTLRPFPRMFISVSLLLYFFFIYFAHFNLSNNVPLRILKIV